MKQNALKKNIRLIALDLDWTTLNGKSELTPVNRKMIVRALDSGITVAVATGRSFYAIPEEIKSIEGIRYFISANGAHVTDAGTGTNIYDSFIEKSAVLKAIELSKAHGIMLEAFYDGQPFIDAKLYDSVLKHGSVYRNTNYVLTTRKPVDDIYALMTEHIDRLENINFFFPDKEEKERMFPIISTIENGSITTSFPNNIELGGVGANKGLALKALAEHLGIDRNEILAIGDAPNDIAMIEYAGIGVAVDNAWDGTKTHADFVTKSNAEDGVAYAIAKIVFGEED
jgi:Cof subfamily protein (haloacid dehalogenase superfamily)